jgi:hypothetical protein
METFDRTPLKGDIVQITDPAHAWFPCLLIVDEVKIWGVQAACYIPKSNDGSEPVVHAFNRLEYGTFEICGTSLFEN